MNRSAALAIRYGIVLARNEAARWYYAEKTHRARDMIAEMWNSEQTIRRVVRRRYQNLALQSLSRSRPKAMLRVLEKIAEDALKMLG